MSGALEGQGVSHGRTGQWVRFADGKTGSEKVSEETISPMEGGRAGFKPGLSSRPLGPLGLPTRFGCGSLCALGPGSFAAGPGLSGVGGFWVPLSLRGACSRVVASLLYSPGLTGAAGAEGHKIRGH